MSATSSKTRKRAPKKSNKKAASSAVSNMGSTYREYNPSNRNTTTLSATSVPRSYGITATSNALSMLGYRGPKMSDCSTDGAVTCCGNAMWSNALATGVVYPGLFAGYGSWAFLPSQWGRIGALADLYSYYRIRRLRITMIPSVGTAAAGIWALGINDGSVDVDSSVGDNFAIGVLSQYPNAVIGPVWQPLSSSFTYNGPKVWWSKADGGTEIEEWQVDMLSSSSGLSSSITYGLLYAEFEIDFLLPSSTAGSPTLSKTVLNYTARKEKARAESLLNVAQANVRSTASAPQLSLSKEPTIAPILNNKDDFVVVHSSYLTHLAGLNDLSPPQKTSDNKPIQ